jgi:hypothetical protein
MRKCLTAFCLLFAVACKTNVAVAPPAAVASPPVVAPVEAERRATNEAFVRRISQSIAGRENEPAETVFKNIQWLKGVPAGRLLRIMNGGYSAALAVTCTHCHVETDFASDEKRPKRATREMAVMHRMINAELRKMQNLASPADKRAINCTTCHRGSIDPMADTN